LQQPADVAEQSRISKEFILPGDMESLAASRQALMDFLAPHCSGDLEEVDILLAAQEALANAILHGCRNDASKTIHCSVMIDPSAFTITVRDPGRGFDVEAATQASEAGSNTTTHGRGIAMMRSLMDEVVYRRGGAEVQLRKLRSTPASSAGRGF
jgi:serine/threonine-protein kinase RsbW